MSAHAGIQSEPSGSGLPAEDVPDCSVVIVAFNCRELLRDCLASLDPRHQELPMEVVVVDSGSTDGTPDVIPAEFPWVRYVYSEENLGFSRGNNLAFEQVTGRQVLLLNPDTTVPPGGLKAAVEALDARPSAGMLGVRLVQPSGELDHAAKRGFPTPLSALYHFVGLTKLLPSSPRFAAYTAGHVPDDREASVDAVNGAFMLVRREALEQVGPLDERFWMYMEDLDWCYRFHEAGWDVVYWPGVDVMHVKGGSATSYRAWKTNRAFHHGMWMFYDKHYRARRSPLVTAAVWLGIWAKLAVSATRSAVMRRRSRA